ncbi:hypothetical protein ABL840_09170 [Variovorax sp. NFACC27]|uniref:hypothetical protein n=1 Tax=unclassified Variovorax TaxID=663243 RepID=UPI00089D9450|nr:hypothetical protein SAMN03159371_05264 [Variovorax sp. NFACC28]SEG89689.1 hypothetical protein SAMN03159365_05183 [Variovorax sp. NFACC29]SFD40122.1 hypothetical protein SAMN03159379_05154 [Variovorax sp. NFACC26]SFG42414.1 hypothetical protein SAMN03159447_03264 [Variovorax sp. NFACC27]
MNLHSIVRSAITTVNPDIQATLLRSDGYVTAPGGKQVPKFLSFSGKIQVQGVSAKDLQHTDFLNIQGVLRTVYLLGNWAGVVRADQKGGDIMKFPQIPGALTQDWRVVSIKETWPDWCSVIVNLQTGTITP